MIESVIMFLIAVCIIALVVYLILWVLGTVIGIQLPQKVIQILWVIFALVCILYLARLFLGGGGLNVGKFKLSDTNNISVVQNMEPYTYPVPFLA